MLKKVVSQKVKGARVKGERTGLRYCNKILYSFYLPLGYSLLNTHFLKKMRLILYSKPDCHLCEGLQQKLEQIQGLSFDLEIRIITNREDWFQAYQYEVPVLFLDTVGTEVMLPRPSPRATVPQLERMLQKYLTKNEAQ
jgi:glutaredoxin